MQTYWLISTPYTLGLDDDLKYNSTEGEKNENSQIPKFHDIQNHVFE